MKLDNFRRKFLRIHGTMLFLVGITAAITSLIGKIYGTGPFGFLKANQMVAIGLFEAYLLAAVCGVFLLVGSFQEKVYKWNRMGAIIHVPLFTTNIIFWNFYSEVGMEMGGIISTIAHGILICVESFLGFSKIETK